MGFSRQEYWSGCIPARLLKEFSYRCRFIAPNSTWDGMHSVLVFTLRSILTLSMMFWWLMVIKYIDEKTSSFTSGLLFIIGILFSSSKLYSIIHNLFSCLPPNKNSPLILSLNTSPAILQLFISTYTYSPSQQNCLCIASSIDNLLIKKVTCLLYVTFYALQKLT